MAFQKTIDEVTKADIDALVDARVAERQALDYKQALPATWADRDRRDLLADLCSFANTSGGWIVYGVREKRDANGRATGIPDTVTGLAGLNVDQERLRIEQMAAAGIEPRIPGLRIEAVRGFNDGPVLLVHVPRSWLRPHMLVDRSPFYGRNSSGKYQLDLQQIRSSVLGAENVVERIRRFRQDRLAAILSGAGPGPMPRGCKVLVHIVPLAAFDGPPNRLAIPLEQARLLPIGGGATGYRYTLEGRLGHEQLFDEEEKVHKLEKYVLAFRTGQVEAVSSFSRDSKAISSYSLEVNLIERLSDYLRTLRGWNVPPPVFVMVTILEAQGWALAPTWEGRALPFDRDLVELPEVMIEDLAADAAQVLRPVLDMLWQSVGAEGCPYYRDDGSRR